MRGHKSGRSEIEEREKENRTEPEIRMPFSPYVHMYARVWV